MIKINGVINLVMAFNLATEILQSSDPVTDLARAWVTNRGFQQRCDLIAIDLPFAVSETKLSSVFRSNVLWSQSEIESLYSLVERETECGVLVVPTYEVKVVEDAVAAIGASGNPFVIAVGTFTLENIDSEWPVLHLQPLTQSLNVSTGIDLCFHKILRIYNSWARQEYKRITRKYI